MASVVTAYVYHGINRRLLGQHAFEFLSRSDTFYRLLYTELDPVKFMCESLSLSSTDVLSLDCALADTFTSNAPEGFNFLGIHKNTEGESFIAWTWKIIFSLSQNCLTFTYSAFLLNLHHLLVIFISYFLLSIISFVSWRINCWASNSSALCRTIWIKQAHCHPFALSWSSRGLCYKELSWEMAIQHCRGSWF